MKIYFGVDLNRVGGGWTFANNLVTGLKDQVQFVNSIEDCDLFFISGATMVNKEDVYKAKELGKKIILRVDNAVKDSRNRGVGMSRLRSYAEKADKVIYQSKWARDYLTPFLNKSGAVIMNGCDTSIFKPEGNKIEHGNRVYLYVRFNRDETKGWHEAWYRYQMIQRENPSAILWIVGNFSDDLRAYNFDFFNGERFKYWGVINDKEVMAQMYRSADYLIYPFYNDACSNTLIEAKCCGTKIILTPNGSTGGSPEILNKEGGFGLDKMCEKYMRVFNEVMMYE